MCSRNRNRFRDANIAAQHLDLASHERGSANTADREDQRDVLGLVRAQIEIDRLALIGNRPLFGEHRHESGGHIRELESAGGVGVSIDQAVALAVDADVCARNRIVAGIGATHGSAHGPEAREGLPMDQEILYRNLAGLGELARRIDDVAVGVLRAERERPDGNVGHAVEAVGVGLRGPELAEHLAADDDARAGNGSIRVVVAHMAFGRAATEELQIDGINDVGLCDRPARERRLPFRGNRLQPEGAAVPILGISRHVLEEERSECRIGFIAIRCVVLRRTRVEDDFGILDRRAVAGDHPAVKDRRSPVVVYARRGDCEPQHRSSADWIDERAIGLYRIRAVRPRSYVGM